MLTMFTEASGSSADLEAWINPALWAEIWVNSEGRTVVVRKVKAHLSQEEFTTLFPDESGWSWIGMPEADSQAQTHANKHTDRDRAAVVNWVDNRVVTVAEHLVTAALLWMQKPWQLQSGKASCANCRLLLSSNMSQVRLRQCAPQQCIEGGSATVLVGHPSHLFRHQGLSWKCLLQQAHPNCTRV